MIIEYDRDVGRTEFIPSLQEKFEFDGHCDVFASEEGLELGEKQPFNSSTLVSIS